VKKPTLKQRLSALRSGIVTFEEFLEQTEDSWENLAGYFLRRWPGQAAINEEDLKQEILSRGTPFRSGTDPGHGDRPFCIRSGSRRRRR
jgi:hypothetical protein